MLFTYSSFNYGHDISSSNMCLDFAESTTEIKATLRVGDYTLGEFADEIARAMNEAGSLTYTVSVNRATRKLVIAASGTFKLLIVSGSRLGASVFPLAGFTGIADLTGANNYTGNLSSGYTYIPQTQLQEYLDFQDNRELIDSSTTVSSDGSTVQTVSNGDSYFMECNIKFSNNYQLNADWIIDNPTGIADLRNFLLYATRKKRLEFIYNTSDNTVFEKCILESTPESGEGTSFRMKEMVSNKLVGYFETGKLKFRKVV